MSELRLINDPCKSAIRAADAGYSVDDNPYPVGSAENLTWWFWFTERQNGIKKQAEETQP